MRPGEHIEVLEAWAATKGLEVHVVRADQRDPENIVMVSDPGGGPALLRRGSFDSVDTAAMYVVNTLERFGINPTEEVAGADGR
jgi:hypothetical protein